MTRLYYIYGILPSSATKKGVIMLSKENIAKLNFNGIYSHKPDVKYRGKLYKDDLYWCFNWIFKVQKYTYSDTKETYYKMIDTYYGDKGIKLTDENFDEFTFMFDMNEVEEIGKSARFDYNEGDVYEVAIGSGGWQYSRKFFIKKGICKNKDIVINRLRNEIKSIESNLEYKKFQLKKVENDEIELKYVF